MTYAEFRSNFTVELVRHTGDDNDVIQAARVSVVGANNPGLVPSRLIDSLMSHRHGVPFEHTSFTFYIEVPIFVARQWGKHRISSINEKSGRYGELNPHFYIPNSDRPMINTGTKMEPNLIAASPSQFQVVENYNKDIARKAWQAYQFQLKYGIAEEVARQVLPVSVYTQFYWTVNARSLMNFLERRVNSVDNRIKTYPQQEINIAADQVEAIFKELMPLTHAAFVKYGRVTP